MRMFIQDIVSSAERTCEKVGRDSADWEMHDLMRASREGGHLCKERV